MNESTLVPREEIRDLDWLARNVHVWPTNTPHIVPAGDCVFEFGVTFFENHACVYNREHADSEVIHKKQWLARRAELQNKPSWALAPEWADWLAQDTAVLDGIGAWWWYRTKPTKGDRTWSCKGYSSRQATTRGEVLGDWRDTLEKRPEQDEFEAFTSIEDNQEKGMTQQQEVKQDNGWFERGELPPVGEVCEWLECRQTGWQKVTLAGHYENAAWIVPEGKEPITVFNPTGFRPIRTERDVLIEIIKKTDDTDDRIADAILAAGFSLGAK